MPKYEDLDFLRNQLLSFGDEISIKAGKREDLNMTPIPEKLDKEAIRQKEQEKNAFSNEFLNDVSDDLKEGNLLFGDESGASDEETKESDLNNSNNEDYSLFFDDIEPETTPPPSNIDIEDNSSSESSNKDESESADETRKENDDRSFLDDDMLDGLIDDDDNISRLDEKFDTSSIDKKDNENSDDADNNEDLSILDSLANDDFLDFDPSNLEIGRISAKEDAPLSESESNLVKNNIENSGDKDSGSDLIDEDLVTKDDGLLDDFDSSDITSEGLATKDVDPLDSLDNLDLIDEDLVTKNEESFDDFDISDIENKSINKDNDSNEDFDTTDVIDEDLVTKDEEPLDDFDISNLDDEVVDEDDVTNKNFGTSDATNEDLTTNNEGPLEDFDASDVIDEDLITKDEEPLDSFDDLDTIDEDLVSKDEVSVGELDDEAESFDSEPYNTKNDSLEEFADLDNLDLPTDDDSKATINNEEPIEEFSLDTLPNFDLEDDKKEEENKIDIGGDIKFDDDLSKEFDFGSSDLSFDDSESKGDDFKYDVEDNLDILEENKDGYDTEHHDDSDFHDDFDLNDDFDHTSDSSSETADSGSEIKEDRPSSSETVKESDGRKGKERAAKRNVGDDIEIVDRSRDEIVLSDEEIKQIIITLKSLPKEAEKKIMAQIISNKYSDAELRPLIDVLLDGERPKSIIKIYEKITNDTSLSNLSVLKFTGQDFEEQQNSFMYLFKKNVLPILGRITAALVMVALLVVLYLFVIEPTFRATAYYKEGYNNLKSMKFDEVEPYFKDGFRTQPRYNEAVKFARAYADYKRFGDAEDKYFLALRMRPNDKLKLEIADFFKSPERGIRDYERALNIYDEMLKKNRKNVDALLGVADTNYEWSYEVRSKLDDAKSYYLDVLDVNKKNSRAVFGMLNVALREENYDDIMKTYGYIEDNFKNRVNPDSYTNLASYLITKGDVFHVKEILEKAGKSVGKRNMPEIDYQLARYNRYLSAYNEEKTHLENGITRFKIMKSQEPKKYESKKYREIRAKMYNDLGEILDKYSKANLQAEEYFLEAINTYPDFGKPYYNLANFDLRYKVDYENAAKNYEEAERKGFTNDTLNYNLGWLYYKKEQYYDSYKRIKDLLDRDPDNSNLKFMLGTTLYQLGNYDLSESVLLETYNRYDELRQIYSPMYMDKKEDFIIANTLMKVSNNLGAALQQKYLQTKRVRYITMATKYYADSIEYYSKLNESPVSRLNDFLTPEENSGLKDMGRIKEANINLRNAVYYDAGYTEPILFQDFNLDYTVNVL